MFDAILGAVVSLVVGLAIASQVGGTRAPDVLAYLFAVGLGLLMLVRRQFPVLALAATSVAIVSYYIADYPAIGLAVPVAAALYSAAEQAQLRWAIVTAVVLLGTSTFFRLREGDDPAFLFGFEMASSAGLMAAAIALGDNVRMRRLWRLEQRERERRIIAEREQEAARRVEAERVRIARDLHDVLAHTVAVVTMQADVATEALDDEPATTRAALATIRSSSSRAMQELRSTLGLLRGPRDDGRAPTGGLEHLDAMVRATAESGLTVNTRIEGDPVMLPVVVDTTAYRVIQEALTNTLRHAEATQADVVLQYRAGELDVHISDNGRGGTVDGSGHGLIGMRERVELVGGTMRAGPRRQGGFVIDVSLPMEVPR